MKSNIDTDTQCVLSLSYGKDSMASLEAIKRLGWPLHRIVHAEIWATDTIPADLPPMVEFKAKADKIIKERYGVEVEHICAMCPDGTKQTYEKIFYKVPKRKPGGQFKEGSITGFPYQKGAWCNDRLKTNPLDQIVQRPSKEGKIYGFPMRGGQWCTSDLKRAAIRKAQSNTGKRVVQYVGIAIDEPERLERLDGVTKISPLAAIGWTEADARQWCEENDLLSPIYTSASRGGCWFCHNQSIDQMRKLRKDYPELWQMLMKWELDSPVPFKAHGHDLIAYDRRFRMEEQGQVPMDGTFRWSMIYKDFPMEVEDGQ